MELNEDQKLRVRRILSFLGTMQALGHAMIKNHSQEFSALGSMLMNQSHNIWSELEELIGMTWETTYHMDGGSRKESTGPWAEIEKLRKNVKELEAKIKLNEWGK